MAAGVGTRDYQRSQVALRAITYSDTATIWRLLDPERLDDTFPKFAAAAIRVIETRRATSGQLARQYLAVRRSGAVGTAPVIPTPKLDHAAALISLRVTSVASIKSATARMVPLERASRNALVRTMGAVDKYVADAGRELIRASVAADPAALGWIRVTLGTCDFCAKKAAGDHMQAGDAHFPRHDHCGCQPEPQYEGLTPEEEFVQKIHKMLKGGDLTEDQARAMLADSATKPLSKANLQEALNRLESERAEIAAVRAERAASASQDAFLTPSQYDALRPTSTWSAEKRDEILKALRETPEGKVLADTLERFQDGGSIARLRTKIDKYAAGADIDATSKARAEALLNAIRHSPEWSPDTLYRGMTVRGKLDNVIAKYRQGESLDLNLSSFTTDRNVAKGFQKFTAKGAGNETRVMVELVGDGKKTIPIQNLPKDKRLFREKEWVSAGRYEIVAVKKSAGSVLLRIKQIGGP
jgi:hypothetical protein